MTSDLIILRVLGMLVLTMNARIKLKRLYSSLEE